VSKKKKQNKKPYQLAELIIKAVLAIAALISAIAQMIEAL